MRLADTDNKAADGGPIHASLKKVTQTVSRSSILPQRKLPTLSTISILKDMKLYTFGRILSISNQIASNHSS